MNARSVALAMCLSLATLLHADAQSTRARTARSRAPLAAQDTGQRIELFGFAQADLIYDFQRNNPDWFDTNRPSRLPSFNGEFGRDGRTWVSARQSRLGVKGTFPTRHGDLKTVFDFDMFGVGPDAGQTTIRLRHAYGQLGAWGAGQLESPFMDLDVFPNTVEYWGPNGMLFFRNVMLFYQPLNKDGSRFTVALERPGASGDLGVYAERVELADVTPRFPAPDLSAEYRLGTGWGYLELAGMLRWLAWDDNVVDAFDLNGSTTGWGVSLSSNVNINASKRDVLRLQVIYGAGVENYFNDAPIDVGIQNNLGNAVTPVTGKALPDLGVVAYLDHRWNRAWTSAIGWSLVNIENSDAQSPSAFHQGQYASVNALYSPIPQVLMGPEFLWGYRKNFSDAFTFNDYRLQFAFKYSFTQTFGGGQK
jgi:hypothetical protein